MFHRDNPEVGRDSPHRDSGPATPFDDDRHDVRHHRNRRATEFLAFQTGVESGQKSQQRGSQHLGLFSGRTVTSGDLVEDSDVAVRPNGFKAVWAKWIDRSAEPLGAVRLEAPSYPEEKVHDPDTGLLDFRDSFELQVRCSPEQVGHTRFFVARPDGHRPHGDCCPTGRNDKCHSEQTSGEGIPSHQASVARATRSMPKAVRIAR